MSILFQAWFTRQLCRLREARRLRAALRELAVMDARELRDLGLADTASALATARAQARTCCA